MKTKHTPGPWHILEVTSTRNGGQTDYLLANKSPHVHGNMTGPMNEADLNLIIAAPDMFDALENFEKTIKNTSIFSPQEFKAWSGLLDAIAKARGEK